MEEIDEVTNVPKHWQVVGEKAHIVSSPLAKEGSYALEITPPDAGYGWVRSSTMRVQPNTEYRIRIAFLAKGKDGGALPFYGVRIYQSDTGWNPPDQSPYLIQREDGKDNGKDWVEKEASFQTGERTEWIYIGILVGGGKGGTLLVDEVSVE